MHEKAIRVFNGLYIFGKTASLLSLESLMQARVDLGRKKSLNYGQKRFAHKGQMWQFWARVSKLFCVEGA